MAKKTSQQIANEAFQNSKDLDKVFVTSDGYPFATENAANLHKNTSGKKALKIYPFTRPEMVSKPATNKVTDAKPVKLDKLKLDELRAVATKEGIRFEDKATKAQLIADIEKVRTEKTSK
ncbi:hypothetical protein MC378_10415 [Polaribacter sp. MSW13]|uniref:Uncharacterized protein n=1 Tax=Polaribacter marinus TaxID=2916838 RepID=A0A9X1VNV8_9FLAO|nr:hypothetical protein [Polaribacter marinus]MCI2229581.1 hypothetical protein [Polaribacter marinus]